MRTKTYNLVNRKWRFCIDHECESCGKILFDEMYPNEDVVSYCKFCNRSFVE